MRRPWFVQLCSSQALQKRRLIKGLLTIHYKIHTLMGLSSSPSPRNVYKQNPFSAAFQARLRSTTAPHKSASETRYKTCVLHFTVTVVSLFLLHSSITELKPTDFNVTEYTHKSKAHSFLQASLRMKNALKWPWWWGYKWYAAVIEMTHSTWKMTLRQHEWRGWNQT